MPEAKATGIGSISGEGLSPSDPGGRGSEGDGTRRQEADGAARALGSIGNAEKVDQVVSQW